MKKDEVFAALTKGGKANFSLQSEEETIPEEEVESEEEGKKKKKPEETPAEEAGTTTPSGDELGFDIRKQVRDTKKALSRFAKVMDLPDPNEGQEAYDALKELGKTVNDNHRLPMIADNGSVLPLKQLFAKEALDAFNLLQAVPTTYKEHEATVESRELLNDIRATLNEIINANSDGDRYALLLGARNLYLNLMSANVMLTGEAALVNGDAQGDQSDLWKIYQLFTDESFGKTLALAVHDRDGVGDNAKEPDVTIIKPMFAIFPCYELKKQLMALGVKSTLIGDYDNMEDFGILGHFSIPTCFGGNSNSDATPNEEDRKMEGLFSDRFLVADNDVPAINAPAFSWSHNGTNKVHQKAPKSYRKNNDLFIKEIKELRARAEAKHLAEFSIDVCFCVVLTGVLNAIFKVIVEANTLGVKGQVKIGQKFNADRFVGLSGSDVLFNLLSDYQVGHSNKDGDGNLFSSVLDMPKYFADAVLSTELSGRFHYSEAFYDLIRKEFKTETLRYTSSGELCIGKVVLGNDLLKVTIIPKIYLPVDVSEEITDANIELEYARSWTGVAPIIDNPFSFAIVCRRTKYVPTRNVNENQYLLNISIFHTICQMTNAEYAGWLDYFYNSGKNMYIVGVDGEEIPLKTLFGNVNASEGYLGYPRLFSSMAPAYTRSHLVGLSRLNITGLKKSSNYLAYPLMDKAWDYNAARNVDTAFLNTYKVFRLSDYIKAVYNEHADFSWIEAMIVATLIQSRYMDKPLKATDDGDKAYHYETVHFYTTEGNSSQAANRMATTTAFRRAIAFMDDKDYGLGFKRFKGSMTDGMITEHSTRINKNDIRNAFRYALYNRTNYYLVDTQRGVTNESKKFWLKTESGKITGISRLCREDEVIDITEKAFIDEVHIKEYFSGALLCYDAKHTGSAVLNIVPEVIPGTKLVGHKFTSATTRNKVMQSIVEVEKVYTKLNLNEYCYIDDDFFPTEVIYTLTVPTNTAQLCYVYNVDSVAMNNIKLFDIALKAAHRAGLDHGNPQGFRLLLQFAMGVAGRVSTKPLATDSDAFNNHYGTDYVSGDDQADYITKTGAESEEAESFYSSFRYATSMVVPAFGALTGLPIHINMGSAMADFNVWSMSHAKHFSEMFGTIIENNRSEVQTYHRGEDKSRLSFFAVRGGHTSEYGDDSWNITISLPVRDIIKTLEMEVK